MISHGRELITSAVNDLAAFVDLGTDAPRVTESALGFTIRFVRDGLKKEYSFLDDGGIVERNNDERRYANLRSLLASPDYANLGKWADSQTLQLKNKVQAETIPIFGTLDSSCEQGGVDSLDETLVAKAGDSFPRTLITLLNGPAGIGKTGIIRSLAYRRASDYRRQRRPLILHVESRGRVLQNITDLMAFSLQTLRLSVTYDQIPALVRNGLVTLAIDGFDELGDPSGYGLAWAQVNDLIVSSRGQGSLILAGRETFISADRMTTALTALSPSDDTLHVFSLCPLRPADARGWLERAGWTGDLLESEAVSPLFELGSYALRPFFISELARPGVSNQIEDGVVQDLLSFLMEAMTLREAGKFGRDIEAVTTLEARGDFIVRFMEEVARDLAENQTDAISVESLSWLAEMVAYDIVDTSLFGVLKNRADVMAFLVEDDRRGYRRFVHEQVANYFLSKVTIRAITASEIPKFIRRNILGMDFLENFCSVARGVDAFQLDNFVGLATEGIVRLGDSDRARKNLAALVVAVCSVAAPNLKPTIRDLSLDELYMAETVSPIMFERVTVGQLLAREADFREVQFGDDCFIVSLLADDGTIPSPSTPLPNIISLPGSVLIQPAQKRDWFRTKLAPYIKQLHGKDLQNALNRLELFNLLSKVARYKPFWLKDGEERAARRIVDDPYWGDLKELLLKHDLLSERHDVQASGRPGPFYHIKNRQSLLQLDNPSEALRHFIADLLMRQIEISGRLTAQI